MRVEGKAGAVTGAASGSGQAIAQLLAAEGAPDRAWLSWAPERSRAIGD